MPGDVQEPCGFRLLDSQLIPYYFIMKEWVSESFQPKQ